MFSGVEVGLKIFFICALEMVVGPLWKHSRYSFKDVVWASLKE